MKTTKTSLFAQRIQKVKKFLKEGEILLLFSAKHQIRNRDVEYKFRQDSDFYYLTGILESDSILFISHKTAGMFCLPKDKEKEIWTGIRLGKEKIQKELELDEVYDNSEWSKKAPELLTNKHTLFYFFGKDSKRDSEILQLCHSVSEKAREGKFGPDTVKEPKFLHQWRKIKEPWEVDRIRHAAEITAKGHLEIMQKSRPGMFEFELEGILEGTYLKNGAWGGGYGHIVASGKNACVLHYVENNAELRDGELVLVDSGAEIDYFTADVTRVFPAGKKFTEAQKIVYEVVLASQKNAIAMSKEGTSFLDIHLKTVRFLSDCLREMKFLEGSLDSIIETKSYMKFYMHRTGHFLGMDVHDVGKYYENGKSILLQNNQIITVEPGLYFDPSDPNIPKEFRGIGIRIEDDILVQGQKPVNLTADIPKEISEIEALKTG